MADDNANNVGVGWKGMGVADGLQNVFTGLGTEKDKRFNTFFGIGYMGREQLDAAYRGDWIARKGCDIPAFDATREWRTWQVDGEEANAIEDLEQTLSIQLKVMKAMVYGRLYGGGALILGIDQGQPEEPLDPENIEKGQLKFVHALSRWDLTAGPINWDITSPWYARPEYYTPTQTNSSTSGQVQQIKLHPSRVITFTGNEIPDPNQTQGGWGDSVLQSVSDAVVGAGTTTSAISQMVSEAKLDVISIPGLSENIINPEYESRLKKRFGFANIAKSVFGILLLDKEETWERIQSNFSGLPEVLKTYLLIASAAFDIPSTRFLSQSPSGMDATGDSDTRNYYDRVSTEQKVFVGPRLDVLDRVLVRSALGPISNEDYKALYYTWNPLWQLSDNERGTIINQKAAAFKIDCDAGLINQVVLKKAREAQLIADGTYPGLQQIIDEFDDDPELEGAKAEEEAQAAAIAAAQAALLAGGAAPVTDPNDPNYDPTKDPNSPQFVKPTAANENEAGSGAPSSTSKAKPKAARGAKAATAAAVDGIVRRLADASTPRSLYVRRDVLNPDDIAKWAKSQGFKSVVPDMHVTIMYSKQPVDWLKIGSDDMSSEDAAGKLIVRAGGPRVIERFGKAVVLGFANSDLSWRHRSMMRRGEDDGISWDYEDFTPHVSITYDPGAVDLENVEPYTGQIVLGPEIFEEIKLVNPAESAEAEETL